MEDKVFLNKEQLDKVSGGVVVACGLGSDRTCPDCGSDHLTFLGEQFDAGLFKCEDCGCSFYTDI